MFSDAFWGVRPDGSSQGGYLVYASSHALHEGHAALVGIIEWTSWKLSRTGRSGLSAESQAMADAIGILNLIRLFDADCLHPEGIDLRQPDRVLQLLPESCAITGGKSLYDAFERMNLCDWAYQNKNINRGNCNDATNACNRYSNAMGKQRPTTCRCIN